MEQIKNLILYFIFVLPFLACNSAGKDSGQDKDSIETIEISDEDIVLDTDKKSLEEVIKQNKLAMEQLQGLKSVIENKDKIKSVAEIEKAFSMRDSLRHLLNNDEQFSAYMDSDEGALLDEELKKLGFYASYAEGMFGSLQQGPLLEDIIEKVADEPFALKNKIENLLARTYAGEYPYTDITEEMQIVPLAEKMITKYPNHKYNKRIIEILKDVLFPVIDVHQVGTDQEKHISFILGEYGFGDYPWATDISFHKKFAMNARSSRYSKVVEKILASISTLETYDFKMVYYVEVPDLHKNDSVFTDNELNEKLQNLSDEIKSQDSWFIYSWLGVDIAHTFKLGDNNDKIVYIYRFFDKKEPAQKSLKVIQELIPSAKLVEYKLSEEELKDRN